MRQANNKYKYMPITSFDGPLLGFKKSRSRGKDKTTKGRKGKDEKEDKTLIREKQKHQVFFFWVFFTLKLGKIEIMTLGGPLIEDIYIYIYTYNFYFILRTRRIGANPEKSDLVNFRGPD